MIQTLFERVCSECDEVLGYKLQTDEGVVDYEPMCLDIRYTTIKQSHGLCDKDLLATYKKYDMMDEYNQMKKNMEAVKPKKYDLFKNMEWD